MMLGALIDLGVPLEVIGHALDQIGAGRQRLRVTHVTKSGIAAVDIKVDTRGQIAGAQRHQHAGHVHTGHPPGRSLRTARTRTGTHMATTRTETTRMATTRTARTHTNTESTPTRMGCGRRHPRSSARRRGTRARRPPPRPRTHARARALPLRRHPGPDRRAALTEGTKRRALDIFDRIARAEAKLHGTTVADVAFHEVGAIDSVVDVVGTAAALDCSRPHR